jgi:predicted Ser/Thr protein kinase
MNERATDEAPEEPPPSAAGPRTLGGRYVIEQALASGGMATVYVGRDTVLDRTVAIKVLRPEPGEEVQEDFLREARAVALLKHPNIVDVYDAGMDGDVPYIVMEYVPGETLRDLLLREGPLPPVRAATLAATLAEALEYAHRRGVVHCDIKPGNVLLPAEDLPKIVDFGIAQITHTETGPREAVAGTAGYIAPEQLAGETPDGRADEYSLAAVLYEMLTGRPPQEGRSLAALATVPGPRPASLRQRSPGIPGELAAIVTRGLEPERAQRYPSAGDFAAALRAFLDSATRRPTERVPVGTAAATADAATERLPPVAAAPPVGPTPVVTAPPAGTHAQATGAAPPALPHRERGRPLGLVVLFGVLLAGAAVAAAVFAVQALGGGSAPVTVPAVSGLLLDDAAARLHDARLTVGTDVQFVSGPQPFGTVLRQEPAAGTRLRRDAPVRLVVSGIAGALDPAPPAGTPAMTDLQPRQIGNEREHLLMAFGSGFRPGIRAAVGEVVLGRDGGRVEWINERLVTLRVPPGLPPGTYTVGVTNLDGRFAKLDYVLTITAPAADAAAVAPPAPTPTPAVPPTAGPSPSPSPSPSPTPTPTAPPTGATPSPTPPPAPAAVPVPRNTATPAPSPVGGQPPGAEPTRAPDRPTASPTPTPISNDRR